MVMVIHGVRINKDWRSEEGVWFSNVVRLDDVMYASFGQMFRPPEGLLEELGLSELDQADLEKLSDPGRVPWDEFVKLRLENGVDPLRTQRVLDDWVERLRKAINNMEKRISEIDNEISTG